MKVLYLIALMLVLYLLYEFVIKRFFFKKEIKNNHADDGTDKKSVITGKLLLDDISESSEKKAYKYIFSYNGEDVYGVIVLSPNDNLVIEDFIIGSDEINIGIIEKNDKLVSFVALTKP